MNLEPPRKSGFSLVEILVVVAISGLLAVIAIPNFAKARTTAQRTACIANLTEIDGAKEQWALENKKIKGASADPTGINSYLKNGMQPACPAKGTYNYQILGVSPTCSIGAALGHTLSMAPRTSFLGKTAHLR